MNPQDAAFFLIEQRRQPMHVAALQIFRPPVGAGEDFVQRLYQSWRKHPQAQRPLNLRPVNPLGRWGWEVDQEFDVDYHLRHLALPRPGRIRELLVLVSQLHSTLLDRNRPPWEAYLIEGLADGRFALYFKMHHGLVDGVTGIRMVTSALATSPKKLCPPLWDVPSRKPMETARAAGAAAARATAKPCSMRSRLAPRRCPGCAAACSTCCGRAPTRVRLPCLSRRRPRLSMSPSRGHGASWRNRIRSRA
jgi:diacylglycerol O-acyltransferase